jgi:hypothetical protein
MEKARGCHTDWSEDLNEGTSNSNLCAERRLHLGLYGTNKYFK